MLTICNGDVTTFSIPQSFTDVTGSIASAQLPSGIALNAPALGTPVSGVLTNCTFPTLNQNTTGTAGGLTGTPAITVGAITSAAITASGLITGSANIHLGVAGSLSGVITLEGSTSGACTITAPAVAGTTSNAIVFSNAIQTLGIAATGTVGVTGAITASLTLGVTGITTLTGGLATLTKYNGVTLTGNGIPSEVGVATATTASAAVTATTLLAAPVAATMYRISAYMKITVATSTPVAGPITLTYADKDGVAQSVVMQLQNAAGATATSTGSTTTTPVSGETTIYVNSGTAIQYAIGFSGTGTYEYTFKVEQL
jgi:hypothetical protein